MNSEGIEIIGRDELRRLKQELQDLKEYGGEVIGEYEKQTEELQERIDKAIEWVNNHIETYTQNGIGIIDWNYDADPRKLLEILKGEDKE